MGLLEAVVVLYLRELYYPGGFRFPLVALPGWILRAELLRELTTIGMLLGVAALTGHGPVDRFFVFAFLFGIWDLVYYAGLRWFVGWPDSPWTWDVLFLVPLPWIGPVVYPAGVAALLVIGFAVHEALARRGTPLGPTLAEWATATSGAVLVVASFCWNWRVVADGLVPERFPAELYAAGIVLGVAPFATAAARAVGGPRS